MGAVLALSFGGEDWASAAQPLTNFRYSARLAAPLPAPKVIRAGSLSWSCRGSNCFANSTVAQPSVGQCRALAGQVGQIAAFGNNVRQLGPSDLRQCSVTGLTLALPRNVETSTKGNQGRPGGSTDDVTPGGGTADDVAQGNDSADDVGEGAPSGGLVLLPPLVQRPPVVKPPKTETTPRPPVPRTINANPLRMTGRGGQSAPSDTGTDTDTLTMTGLGSDGAIADTGTLTITGLGSADAIPNTGALTMTGLATPPALYDVGPMEMTGLATPPAIYDVGPMEMTGLATPPAIYDVGPMEMTGVATPPAIYDVGPMEMTGLRP
jgi:hypothetical protein